MPVHFIGEPSRYQTALQHKQLMQHAEMRRSRRMYQVFGAAADKLHHMLVNGMTVTKLERGTMNVC